MSNRTMTWSLLALIALVALPAAADEAKPKTDAAGAPATSTTAKSHEVEAEVVSVDSEKHTITLKTGSGESTAPVDEKAQAGLKDLKPGQKVTVVCRDDETGEHKAVSEIKASAPAEKPAQ